MIDYAMNHKIVVGIIVLGCLIILVVFFTLISPQQNILYKASPTPTPTQEGTTQLHTNVSPLQKTEIGITTEDQVAKLPGLLDVESLPNGQTKYNFGSPLTSRNNEILVLDGVVIYERALTPVSPSSIGYTTISEILRTFGDPEEMIVGSRFYGWPLRHYIYSTQGFSFIGNPNSDEVYEFSFFEPITTSEYKALYGQDIPEDSGPHIEEH